MNLAPSNPSTTRWSAVNVNVIIGLTVTSPLYTTGFGTVALTPKIAVLGWLILVRNF